MTKEGTLLDVSMPAGYWCLSKHTRVILVSLASRPMARETIAQFLDLMVVRNYDKCMFTCNWHYQSILA